MGKDFETLTHAFTTHTHIEVGLRSYMAIFIYADIYLYTYLYNTCICIMYSYVRQCTRMHSYRNTKNMSVRALTRLQPPAGRMETAMERERGRESEVDRQLRRCENKAGPGLFDILLITHILRAPKRSWQQVVLAFIFYTLFIQM